MGLGVNIDEYVGETMTLFKDSGTKPTKRDVATSIAETLDSQGIIGPSDAEFDAAVAEIEATLDYYLRPGEVRR